MLFVLTMNLLIFGLRCSVLGAADGGGKGAGAGAHEPGNAGESLVVVVVVAPVVADHVNGDLAEEAGPLGVVGGVGGQGGGGGPGRGLGRGGEVKACQRWA